jgi:hypothetical protein
MPQKNGMTAIGARVNVHPAPWHEFHRALPDTELFSSSDFAGLKDVYRLGELPSPSPSAVIAGSLRWRCRW